MNKKNQDRVQWVYSSKNNSELTQRYDEWAKDYDRDLAEFFGWIAPKTASAYLANMFIQILLSWMQEQEPD